VTIQFLTVEEGITKRLAPEMIVGDVI